MLKRKNFETLWKERERERTIFEKEKHAICLVHRLFPSLPLTRREANALNARYERRRENDSLMISFAL